MVISRSPAASQAVSGRLCFGGKTLPLQDHIKILGMSVDRGLSFDHHVAAAVHQVSLRVSVLRRVAGSLDSRGILTLYKAQIRPCMEYGALSWMSSAATYLQRLDAEDQHSSPGVTSLEHRRDVSALVVCNKVQVQEVPHLSSLRFPPRAVQRWSRTTPLSDVLVKVPLSHSSQHQRTYTARTSRLWNMFASATPDVQNMSTHQVKMAARRWRETQTSPLVMLSHVSQDKTLYESATKTGGSRSTTISTWADWRQQQHPSSARKWELDRVLWNTTVNKF
ncbi:hypothetical protein GWK47_041839 [Chionoecetes opilio]|uniref:Uncharacterized protein n=1 Tax=Chionoecetes opilio TaxID=41210 RepID=A0A8J4YIP0_CHIOP|nr:hypothetical protein GWK47_041839 [Chionoecetes opilio]